MSESQKSGRVNRSNYDRLSRWYDLLAARGERSAQAAGMELFNVKAGETVLEIGCGTGQVLLWLGQSIGSPGKVVGIDRSGGMLAQAAGKLQKAALSSRADLVNGDAVHLPFQADFCDGIIMSFTLELFLPEEMIAVLAECRRVLKHAGRLCVVAMAETTDPGSMYRVYAWGPRIFPEWIDCRPIDVQSALSQASFQIRDVIEIGMWGLPIRIVLAEKS